MSKLTIIFSDGIEKRSAEMNIGDYTSLSDAELQDAIKALTILGRVHERKLAGIAAQAKAWGIALDG